MTEIIVIRKMLVRLFKFDTKFWSSCNVIKIIFGFGELTSSKENGTATVLHNPNLGKRRFSWVTYCGDSYTPS